MVKTDNGVNRSGIKICKTKKGKKNTIIYKRRQKDHDLIVQLVQKKAEGP